MIIQSILLVIFLLSFVFSHYIDDIKINLIQPDGSKFSCLSSGNHYYVRLHDKNNNTIIQNELDGYYYYAQLINKKVVPTKYRADKPIPETAEILPGIQITKDEYLLKAKEKQNSQKNLFRINFSFFYCFKSLFLACSGQLA